MPETGSVRMRSFLEDTGIDLGAVACTHCREFEHWTEPHSRSPRSGRCMHRRWFAGSMLDSRDMEQRTVEPLMALVKLLHWPIQWKARAETLVPLLHCQPGIGYGGFLRSRWRDFDEDLARSSLLVRREVGCLRSCSFHERRALLPLG